MGSPIQFSDEDLLRDKILEPGWYKVKITGYNEAPAKDGGSTNYNMSAVVVNNASNGSEEFTGVPLNWNFNSKVKSFAIGYLRALGLDVTSAKRFDLEQIVGETVEMHIKTGSFNDRPKNEVTHAYRAVGSR
jgi:hypothetical protein